MEGLNSRFATAKSELLNWKTDLKKLQRIKEEQKELEKSEKEDEEEDDRKSEDDKEVCIY